MILRFTLDTRPQKDAKELLRAAAVVLRKPDQFPPMYAPVLAEEIEQFVEDRRAA